MFTKRPLSVSRIRILTFFRFTVICIISIISGYIYYLKSGAVDMSIADSIKDLSFENYGIGKVIKNAFSSSLFDFAIILISALSSLTFFCSAALYSVTSFAGIIQGACLGFILSKENIDIKIKTIYIIYIFVFIILLSITQTGFLGQNKRFISQRHIIHHKNKLYFSKLFTPYILTAFVSLCIIYALHAAMLIFAIL